MAEHVEASRKIGSITKGRNGRDEILTILISDQEIARRAGAPFLNELLATYGWTRAALTERVEKLLARGGTTTEGLRLEYRVWGYDIYL